MRSLPLISPPHISLNLIFPHFPLFSLKISYSLPHLLLSSLTPLLLISLLPNLTLTLTPNCSSFTKPIQFFHHDHPAFPTLIPTLTLTLTGRHNISIMMTRSMGDRYGPRSCISLPEISAYTVPAVNEYP
jgi:hypothetical protein